MTKAQQFECKSIRNIEAAQSANGGGDDGDDLANDSGGSVNSPDFEFDSRPQWDFRSRRQLNTANLNPSASSFSNVGFEAKTFIFF